jgi:asparagine N-glycosylation enzyme membrane subunit Stt3
VPQLIRWRYARAVSCAAQRLDARVVAAARWPWLIPCGLTIIVLMKTVLQLSLYLIGYTTYSADDFGRALKADYWLQHPGFDLGQEGWVGLGGTGWLPFPDYLFGLGLAVHRDLFLTPKIMNLVLSGSAVVAVYLLGRELFGRTTGFLAAALFALQPSHVWIGISGLTSDVPSIVLIALFGLFLFRWKRTSRTLCWSRPRAY